MFFKKTANIWVPILVIVAMIALTMLNLDLDQKTELEDQFAIRWNAARSWMMEGWSPYSQETYQSALDLLESNNSLPNPREKGHFLDPAWFVYLFIPISFLPYPIAKAIWMMLIQLSLLASFYVAIKLSGIKLNGLEILLTCLLGALFYPLVRANMTASMLPIFIFLTLLAIRLALQGRGNQAGLLLLFAIWINPVAIFAVLLLVIYLGSGRDNSLARILLIGFGFLMITTLILFPGWLQQWFTNLLRLDPGLSWPNTPLMGVARAFPGAYGQIAVGLHLAAFIMLLVEWYGLGQRSERAVQWKLMLTLTVSYFFNLYSEGAVLLMLMPAFFMVFKYLQEKWPVSGKILYWISFIVIGFFSWQLVSDPLYGFPKEHTSILLLVPLFVFLGLQWFRWWAVASPKALIDLKK